MGKLIIMEQTLSLIFKTQQELDNALKFYVVKYIKDSKITYLVRIDDI